MVQAARIIETELVISGLIGAGIGIGVIFSALILGLIRNPSLRGQLFSCAILGFSLAENEWLGLINAIIIKSRLYARKIYDIFFLIIQCIWYGNPASHNTIVLQSGFNLWTLVATATSFMFDFNKLLDQVKVMFVCLDSICSEYNNIYKRIYPVEIVCPSNDEFFTGFFSLLYNPYITLFLLFLCMLIFIFLIYSIINNKISNIVIVLLVLSMLFIVYFNIGCSLALCNEFHFYKVNNMWKLVFVIYLFNIFIIISFAFITPFLLLFLITKYFVICINNKINREKVIMLPVKSKLQQVVLDKNIPISSHKNIKKDKKIKKGKKRRNC